MTECRSPRRSTENLPFHGGHLAEAAWRSSLLLCSVFLPHHHLPPPRPSPPTRLPRPPHKPYRGNQAMTRVYISTDSSRRHLADSARTRMHPDCSPSAVTPEVCKNTGKLHCLQGTLRTAHSDKPATQPHLVHGTSLSHNRSSHEWDTPTPDIRRHPIFVVRCATSEKRTCCHLVRLPPPRV